MEKFRFIARQNDFLMCLETVLGMRLYIVN